MTEKEDWIPYQELDWLDEKFNVFSIDTRDFHAGYRFVERHDDFDTIKKYPDFFHTVDEVISLIDRYFIESGKEGKWRMFSLGGGQNWNMKYIRIWRTELGFVICNSYNKALRKEFLEQKVNQEYLSKH
jgi:hypothetical protein